MKLDQLILDTEIQSKYKIVYYDYEDEERITVSPDEYGNKDVRYLYVEDGILYIEINIDED